MLDYTEEIKYLQAIVMSVNWEEIIRAGINKLEIEDCCPPSNYQVKSADEYYRQGINYYQQDKFSQAIKQFTQAIALDDNYYLAYFYRGASHLKLSRKTQGLKDYDRAIELKTDYTDGYYYRGYARKSLGDLAGAIADFTIVIQLDPDNIQAYFELAACYCYLGQYQSAIVQFSKLIDFNATAAKHYNRGVTYYLLEEYNKAIADLTKAIELEPDFIAAYYNLSNAYYQIQDCQQASANYRKAQERETELDNQISADEQSL